MYTVILFYKFIDIAQPQDLMKAHKAKAQELGLLGRVIIGGEGINATLEGTDDAIAAYVDFLHADLRFADVLVKRSVGNGAGFTKLLVKVRDEIVTLGAGRFDVARETARALPAHELEQWYERGEDFVVLDLRNDYEIAVGKFDNTIDPGIENFRDLPARLSKIEDLKDKKVVTVCTGGIRCEKATCLLKQQGFSNIYQLKDGIHTYMQEYPGRHFKGALFVFDNRMTTDVVDTPDKEVIGRCEFCAVPTELYCSDDSVRPSRKLLCCDACHADRPSYIRRSAPPQTVIS